MSAIDEIWQAWYNYIILDVEGKMEVKDIIREIRGNRSIIQFAVAVGVQMPTVYAWERSPCEKGQRLPSVPSVVGILKVATRAQGLALLAALGLEAREEDVRE